MTALIKDATAPERPLENNFAQYLTPQSHALISEETMRNLCSLLGTHKVDVRSIIDSI